MELQHYGILGMKWGVRKMIGPDGRVIGRKEASKRLPDIEKAVKKVQNVNLGTSEGRKAFDSLVNTIAGSKHIKDLSKTQLERGETIALKILTTNGEKPISQVNLERYTVTLARDNKTTVRVLDTSDPLHKKAIEEALSRKKHVV